MRLGLVLIPCLALCAACATAPPPEAAPELPSYLGNKQVTNNEEALEARAEAMGYFRTAYRAQTDGERRENFDKALFLYSKTQRFYLQKLDQQVHWILKLRGW